MKVCTVCKTEKTEIMYERNARMKDGYRNQCKECRKAYHSKHYKKYYERTRKEKLVKVKARSIIKAEEIKIYQRLYHTSNEFRAKERERSRLRRADPTGNAHRAFLTRRYLAKKHNAPGYCTKQQLAWRWEYYGHKCWVCKVPATETDHVKPVSKGGSNWPANLRPICKSCNVRKSNLWPYVPTN